MKRREESRPDREVDWINHNEPKFTISESVSRADIVFTFLLLVPLRRRSPSYDSQTFSQSTNLGEPVLHQGSRPDLNLQITQEIRIE